MSTSKLVQVDSAKRGLANFSDRICLSKAVKAEPRVFLMTHYTDMGPAIKLPVDEPVEWCRNCIALCIRSVLAKEGCTASLVSVIAFV
ncbi:hypothetical protein M378DRAFT_166788 [Amanita muscaria Koide BX008]|uniref:Uncharacterized protein n=1 Tax=Amanita muscaria (strain Koide BX008) TaxID=946122 RepID=A0A0C2SEQ1_AMAMK|nr:hypothetical protein M378DRAFT_166788 [Amanita muscaria Koide BX008]